MQYPIIDLIAGAYLNNGWTGLDIPQTITYEPIQLGSGNPSPDNVRPILPATTLNIGGTDIPIYGGSLDVSTGVLTVDCSEVNLGSLTWAISGSGRHNITTSQLQGIAIVPNTTPMSGICSNYVVSRGDLLSTTNNAFGMVNATLIQINDSNLNGISASDFKTAMQGVQLVYELQNPITYQLSSIELENAIGIKDNITHRLKLPLPHYFPHPVIDALQHAAAGTQTADDTEILRHYLTPLGIGGI